MDVKHKLLLFNNLRETLIIRVFAPDGESYGAQNEAYMSRLAEKWVSGLCFNELGVCD